MTTLREFQDGFVKALWSADGVLPDEPFSRDGIPVAAGLAVYRNNVFAGLAGVLGDLYPVVKRLVGDAFFAHAAKAYVSVHPPVSPVLAEYGAGFPDFLAGFEAAQTVPYLGGVAALELARHQALSAPETPPLKTAALKEIPPDRLGLVCFEVHPSVRLVRSPYPVDDILNAHRNGEAPDGFLELANRETRLLVCRPETGVETGVETLALSAEAFDFVSRLIAGDPLRRAFSGMPDGWNPQQTLTDLLVAGVFTDFSLTED